MLVDGGVRGGADVVKALALGANAVLRRAAVRVRACGRAGGSPASRRWSEQLAAETDVTLALVGAGSIADVDASWIAASS